MIKRRSPVRTLLDDVYGSTHKYTQPHTNTTITITITIVNYTIPYKITP